jgi:hypothetical protein
MNSARYLALRMAAKNVISCSTVKTLGRQLGCRLWKGRQLTSPSFRNEVSY